MTICAVCGEPIHEIKREYVKGVRPGQRKLWQHYPECPKPVTGGKPAPAEPGPSPLPPSLYGIPRGCPDWGTMKTEPGMTLGKVHQAAIALGEGGFRITNPDDYRDLPPLAVPEKFVGPGLLAEMNMPSSIPADHVVKGELKKWTAKLCEFKGCRAQIPTTKPFCHYHTPEAEKLPELPSLAPTEADLAWADGLSAEKVHNLIQERDRAQRLHLDTHKALMKEQVLVASQKRELKTLENRIVQLMNEFDRTKAHVAALQKDKEATMRK